MTFRVFKLLPVVVFIFLLGCQDDEEVSTKEAIRDLQGYVQKGPFINGTTITVSELDQKLVATGKNFTTQTTDNKGSFGLEEVKLQSNFVQLIANGFYFDEVVGKNSVAPLTLFALADISDVSSVNINLLSHLEKDRVIYLMQEEAKSFATAKKQAQQEVLAIFGIKKDDMVASERLDISQEGDDNAILLAVSVILQGYDGNVANLSGLLADVSRDIKADGTLDDSSLGSAFINNAIYLNVGSIRKNIADRYQELGDAVIVGNFEKYVKQFIDNSTFAVTRRIEYPVQGFYGENLLSGTKENYRRSYVADTVGGVEVPYLDYDIYAELPEGTTLKVRISSFRKSSGFFNVAWVMSDYEGWTFTEFNETDQSRIFTTTKYGEVRLRFGLHDDIKIELYEQGATIPTRVKNIDAY